MNVIHCEGRTIRLYGDPAANRRILQMTGGEEPEGIANEIRGMLPNEKWCLVSIPVSDWDNALSPWKAEGVFGGRGFGDGAAETLAFITDSIIPELERSFPSPIKSKYLLSGYSLAGLFTLWSAYQSNAFVGIVAASPSVWYPCWLDFVRNNVPKTDRVYLSLGKKEEKARNRLLSSVGDCIREQSDLLTKNGVTNTLEWNEGNHFVNVNKRIACGIVWLLRNIPES